MKLSVLFALTLVLLIVFSESGTFVHGSKIYTDNKTASSVNYYQFINFFYPEDSSFCIMMDFHPESNITTEVGKITSVTLTITKINITQHPDFYVRVILADGAWVPYNRPTGQSENFMEKIKKYNDWLNTSLPLTYNTYYLHEKRLHFSGDSVNISETVKFAIYNWDKNWGLTVIVRPANGTLWIPVEGLHIKIVYTNGINDFLHLIYLITVPSIVLFVNVVLRFRVKMRWLKR